MENKFNNYARPLGYTLLITLIFIFTFTLIRKYKNNDTGISEKKVTIPDTVPVQSANTAQDVAPQVTEPLKHIARTQPVQISPEEMSNRRSQAKLYLSALYTAQAAMHADYQRYSTDLKWMGFGPFDLVMNYKVGFLQEYSSVEVEQNEGRQEDPSRMNSDSFLDEIDDSGKRYEYSPLAAKINLADFAKYCKRGCTAGKDFFEALYVIPLEDGRFDVWVVDHKKKIHHVLDGLRK